MPASSATTASGGALTTEQVQRILIKPLEMASVFLAAGPRIFDVTADGKVRIPRLVSMTAPAWVGENALIPEVDATFGEVTLLDTTVSLKSITRFSNELARSSVVALDAALRDKMVLDVAAKIDQAFFNGAGGTEPLGLLNYAGGQSVAASGVLSLDKLLDADELTYTANADTSRLRWVMPSRTFVSLRKLKDSQGLYSLQPDVTADAIFRLFGIPVLVTNRIPINGGAGTNEGSVVLANCSQIAVARDLAPSVKLLDQTFAEFDQQAIRVVARYDAALLNPAAVVVLRGVTS